MKVIIAVDPGASTGLAILVDGGLEVAFQGTPIDALRILQARLVLHRDDDVIVACERFIQQQHGAMSHEPEAQLVAGKVQAIAEMYGRKCHMQSPSDAHSIVTDQVLKEIGYKVTAAHVKQPDAKDVNMAVRHALLVMARFHARTFDAVVYGTTKVPQLPVATVTIEEEDMGGYDATQPRDYHGRWDSGSTQTLEFNPGQERGDDGRWGGGGDSKSSDAATAPVTTEQERALNAYVDDSTGQINGELRDGSYGDGSPYHGTVDDITNAIGGQPRLTEQLVTYRTMDDAMLTGLKDGDMFQDQGFVSTTTERGVAEDYASDYGDTRGEDKTASVVEMAIPAGERVFNYEQHPKFDDTTQHEVLLQRNGYYIVSHTSSGDVRLTMNYSQNQELNRRH